MVDPCRLPNTFQKSLLAFDHTLLQSLLSVLQSFRSLIITMILSDIVCELHVRIIN